MAFRDATYKTALITEMQAGLWNKESALPGSLGDFNDWSDYYKYKYYSDFVRNTIDMGTVVLSDNAICAFMNETFERIEAVSNNVISCPRWESASDIWSALELVSIPYEDKIGSQVLNEESPENYPMYYAMGYSALPYFNQANGWKDKTLASMGTNNVCKRTNTTNITNTFSSLIWIEGISLPEGWKSINEITQPASCITLVPTVGLDGVTPDWTGNAAANGNLIYKGRDPVRTPENTRRKYYYRKFSYAGEDGSVIGYRYIPLFPDLSHNDTGNLYATWLQPATTSYGFGKGGYFNFGYQPFNIAGIYEFEKAEDGSVYLYSLPNIMFAASGAFTPFLVGGNDFGTQYEPRQVWVKEVEIRQYFYLTGIRFSMLQNTIENGSFSTLDYGDPPQVEFEGEGEIVGPSGETSGGVKEEISGVGGSTAEGTVIRKYPISQHLLSPGFYGGTYIPTYRYIIEITNNTTDNDEAIAEMNKIIDALTRNGKLDSIVENFITYSGFINYTGIDEIDGSVYDYRYYLPGIPINLTRPTYMCGFDSNDPNSYIPVNKKLLTYPFMSFEINGYGERNELKLENWSTKAPRILICSKFLPGATIFVFPENYEAVKNNYDAGVASQPLPILSYTRDNFKNEYNACINSRTASITSLLETTTMQSINSTVGATANIAGAGISSFGAGQFSNTGSLNMSYNEPRGSSIVGNVIKGAAGLSESLLSKHQGLREFEAQLKDVENRPLAIANQNAAPSLPALNSNSAAPFVVWKSVRKEFAKKIDEFFTRYGYRVNKFKEVNIFTRPSFNFLKCSQARVEGSIPQDDLIQIKNILEKGITFWHKTGIIGDYTVYNPAPITNRDVYLNPSYKQ